MPDITPSLSEITGSHYRQIIESAVDYAIVSCDREAKITTWNEGARRVLGWTETEMRGQAMHRFFTPEDVAGGAVEGEMATAEQCGRVSDERWHLRKDGGRFWASGELMPLRSEANGHVTGFVKILRDRTEQRLDEASRRELNGTLKASEARLQMALDVGGMGVWQCDLNTRGVLWWPGMEFIHGLPAGKQAHDIDEYYELVHPDDRRLLEDVLREAVLKKSGYRVEYRVIWPDGSVHWLEARSKLLMDLEGEPWGLSGVCLDITRRKRVESDLKFLAEASVELAGPSEYQSTLDKIARLAVAHFADWCTIDMPSDGGGLQRVAVAHADPAKEHLAREMHRRFPPEPGRIVGAGPFTILATGQAVRIGEVTDEILERAVADTDHVAALRAIGFRSYMGVPLTLRGKTLGVISFATGASGRRYTAQDMALAEDLARRAAVAIENASLFSALQESDRAKDVFLATLAHELRNPLAPVWNGLTIIKRMPGDTARVQEVAGMIERQVGQLTRLVDDLLDVSRITTGKVELKKEPTNLIAILRTAVETSRPHMEAARHKLTLRFPDEPTDLLADPLRLAQVFSNLLNNAAKYTRPGGKIEVEVQTEPQQLSVRVRDNGAGIAPEMLGKVFSLFTQVTHPSERAQGGLGIGLSLVDGLVRLHGGSVEARSEGLDKGSEFIVVLPRGSAALSQGQPQPADDASAGAVTDPASQQRRILVVDDNQDAAITLADLLQLLGSEVSVAHDGRAALAKVTQFVPDVVLLDIGLPDINGYEVARRIRGLEGVRQPRLIALTGWGQEQDKRLAAQAGFDDHWTKPVDPQRLQELSL